ncbi:S-layer homology domain-containing protein, partial [Candidatus Saccharibacteria bacterium]|nr:S-layer homology domain-containing protein [Candidatus Saccharibacteria bacterium]
YIQYNPDSSCGGSTVYIENLATSSLYRYTPYQPNASSLAAGYGTGNSCSAYGNRNFYLYFNDWFGDSTEEGCERFCDMPEDETGKEAVSWMYDNGISLYYSKKGEFAPNAPVTRANLGLFITRLEKINSSISLNEAVAETLKGNSLITRSDAIKYLWYISGKPIENNFEDLPDDDNGRIAITWAYNNGITKYYSKPGEFAPYANISRREVAIFLWRLAGEPETEINDDIFSDLSENDELGRQAITWAYNNGITKYYSKPGEFAPYANISRREVAIFLWKYKGEEIENSGQFNDITSLNAGEKYAITWAYNNGITKYYSKAGVFAPDVNISRREMAIFLYRFNRLQTDTQ